MDTATTESGHETRTGSPRRTIPTRVRRRLEMQGFSCGADPTFPDVVPWLRFSPGLTTAVLAIGTLLAAPALLVGLAVVTGTCATTARHPFDVLYDRAIRPLTDTPALPANEAPRRFACALATAWAMATATAFWTGATTVGYALGVTLVALGGLVSATHFCVGSFVYRLGQRAVRAVY